MDKCNYCNKELDTNSTIYPDKDDNKYCSGICRIKGIKFIAFTKKFLPLYLILILIFISGIILPAIIKDGKIIYSCLSSIGFGISIIIFPFTNSLESLGIKKSKFLGRCGGLVLIIIGIVMIFTYC